MEITDMFYGWIRESVDPERDLVLNLGAGETPPDGRRHMRGRVRRLVGVDPDPAVLGNTDLDEAHVNDGLHLPFPDNSFGVVYSDWTIEHVAQPLPFCQEVYRVLQPAGIFFFRTPNAWHYAALVARATPFQFHSLVERKLFGNRFQNFPTFYRMNTVHQIRAILMQTGFASVEIQAVEPEPNYLRFNRFAYGIGEAYQRQANRHESFLFPRHTLLVKAVRPA